MATAILEYRQTEAALADLRQRYGSVVFDVATTKGMDAAKNGRAEIRGYRTALEAKRKEIKAPALERCRLIDEEAKRITAELVALEDPIDSLIKAEEQRKEREKAERERIKRERIENIQAHIAQFGVYAASLVGKTSETISAEILIAEQYVIGDDFGEFKEQAKTAYETSLAKMRELYAAAVAHEEEQARLVAEREELARLRAEQEKREAEERSRAEAERKRIEAEERERRAKIEAEERAARERIEAQERAARQKIEAEQAEARRRQAEEDARLRAERDRLEAERREAEAKARADREAKEAQEREERRKQAELMDGMQMLDAFVQRYGKRAEFKTIAKSITTFLASQKEQA